MMGSEEGGMEIEKVAAEMPDKIIKEYIDPAIGLADFQASRMPTCWLPWPAYKKAMVMAMPVLVKPFLLMTS